MYILKEVFPGWASNKGIFELFVNPPWGFEKEARFLNIDYFGTNSGSKLVSPLVRFLMENGELHDEARQLLADTIMNRFFENWSRLWVTNVAKYEPIHNYDVHDENVRTKVETSNLKEKSSSVNSTEHGKIQNYEDNVFGFNSIEHVPSDDGRTTDSGVTKVTDNNTTDNTDNSFLNENEHHRRYGNIGVTTSQQMIQQERDVWKWNFFRQVFEDIDSVLTIPFYDPCVLEEYYG